MKKLLVLPALVATLGLPASAFAGPKNFGKTAVNIVSPGAFNTIGSYNKSHTTAILNQSQSQIATANTKGGGPGSITVGGTAVNVGVQNATQTVISANPVITVTGF